MAARCASRRFFSTHVRLATTAPTPLSLLSPPRQPLPPLLAAFPQFPLPPPSSLRRNESSSASPHAGRVGARHGAAHAQVKGVVSPAQAVPSDIVLPPYARGQQPRAYPEPKVHDAASAARMRHASAVAAEVLAAAGELVRPGATGEQIDALVHRLTLARGAYPSPLRYMGFPKSVCVSINEVACHGIPDGGIIRPGDVVSIDVSCFIGGVHGDTCRTWIAGGYDAGDAPARELVSETKHALDAAIAIAGPGVRVSAFGNLISSMTTRAGIHDIVGAYSGHGICDVFHTQPIVNHTRNDSHYVLAEGMTFTIEPILAEGSGEVGLWDDGWTVVTLDGGRAAQFEHTLLVTAHGVDVLTRYE